MNFRHQYTSADTWQIEKALQNFNQIQPETYHTSHANKLCQPNSTSKPAPVQEPARSKFYLQRRQTQENTLTEKSAITETLMLYKRRSNFALQTEHQPEHLFRVKHRFQRNRNISKYLDEF